MNASAPTAIASPMLMTWNASNTSEAETIISAFQKKFPFYTWTIPQHIIYCKVVKERGGAGELYLRHDRLNNTLSVQHVPHHAPKFSADQKLAFMCGTHSRLGADSHVRKLDEEILQRCILAFPQVRQATTSIELIRFIESFEQSNEAVIDHYFRFTDPEQVLNAEAGLCFKVNEKKMERLIDLTRNTLDFEVEVTKFDKTQETEFTLNVGDDHQISITFSPTENLVSVSGVGSEESPGVSFDASEPNLFEYFVQSLHQWILHYLESTRDPLD